MTEGTLAVVPTPHPGLAELVHPTRATVRWRLRRGTPSICSAHHDHRLGALPSPLLPVGPPVTERTDDLFDHTAQLVAATQAEGGRPAWRPAIRTVRPGQPITAEQIGDRTPLLVVQITDGDR